MKGERRARATASSEVNPPTVIPTVHAESCHNFLLLLVNWLFCRYWSRHCPTLTSTCSRRWSFRWYSSLTKPVTARVASNSQIVTWRHSVTMATRVNVFVSRWRHAWRPNAGTRINASASVPRFSAVSTMNISTTAHARKMGRLTQAFKKSSFTRFKRLLVYSFNALWLLLLLLSLLLLLLLLLLYYIIESIKNKQKKTIKYSMTGLRKQGRFSRTSPWMCAFQYVNFYLFYPF